MSVDVEEPDIGIEAELLGVGDVEGAVPASGVAGGVAGGVVVVLASGVAGVAAPALLAGCVPAVASGAWAKTPGAAAASMAATALASAKRCKFVRVDIGGEAPFYKNRSQITVAIEIYVG